MTWSGMRPEGDVGATVAQRGATLTYPARGANRNEFGSLIVHRPLAVATLAAVALALAAPLADAQVLPVPRRSTVPVAWGSLSAGLLQFNNRVIDGRTESVQDFGSALQYRGSLEMDGGNVGAVGLVAGLADAPLTYYSGDVLGGCNGGCDAHAKLWTIAAGFHMGGGTGFHQIINLSAGMLIYRDFTTDDG